MEKTSFYIIRLKFKNKMDFLLHWFYVLYNLMSLLIISHTLMDS